MKYIYLFIVNILILTGCNDTQYGDRNNTIYQDANSNTVVPPDHNRTELQYVDTHIPTIKYRDRNVTIYEPQEECLVREFDATLWGRIVYEDGKPYARGIVKVSSVSWQNYALSDDNGTFRVGVVGDERFFFSAASPFGDFVFYVYDNTLVVPAYTIGQGYECSFLQDIVDCEKYPTKE